jgi:hypothetical protein
MQRQALLALAATLGLGAAGAEAQEGDLARVTMRVLDDVSGVDAVVLELDAGRGAVEDGAAAESSDRADRDAAADGEDRGRDAAGRDDAAAAAAEGARRAERRDELHDVDADERGEGRLEDRDVERPAVPPATAP